MRFPEACYQMSKTIDLHFCSCLLPAQRRCLACWVYGTVQARSACQTQVIGALLPLCGSSFNTLRQYLRDWLYNGTDKAASCRSQVEIRHCFVPLLRWVLSLWKADQLVLAIDVTNLGDRLHALCISVVYRGCAIPVAWHLVTGGEKGAWTPHLCRLLCTLAPAISPTMTVLVVMDAGLRSPALWEQVRCHGWHPLQRHEQGLQFRPAGYRDFHRADSLVQHPGEAWIGTGVAFKTKRAQRSATVMVVWDQGQAKPWVLLTDLEPAKVGLSWYGLRFWIECGFRILKAMGWHWQRTQRTDPERVARHWLVMAVATTWVLATGTRVEDAAAAGRLPAALHAPPAAPVPAADGPDRPRSLSVFQLGLSALQEQFHHRQLWRCLWLVPEPWPPDPPGLAVTRHEGTQEAA